MLKVVLAVHAIFDDYHWRLSTISYLVRRKLMHPSEYCTKKIEEHRMAGSALIILLHRMIANRQHQQWHFPACGKLPPVAATRSWLHAW